MDFRPLSDTERDLLYEALRGNAEKGTTLLMDQEHTGFIGTAEGVPAADVIHAIRSIPVHY
ncbi:MAG: hypothetical protein R3B84_00610 [Zavarzinella sp.]